METWDGREIVKLLFSGFLKVRSKKKCLVGLRSGSQVLDDWCPKWDYRM